MNKITVEIPEGKEAKWVNNVLTLVEKEVKYGDIRDQVKTLDDAIRIANRTPKGFTLATEYHESECIEDNTEAYIRLKIIAYALNDGWQPKGNEARWYPCFELLNENFSFSHAYQYDKYVDTFCGLTLAFKTKKLAEYAGIQFIDIYKKFLL